MSETQLESQQQTDNTTNIPESISDAQVDKFFETGGESIGDGNDTGNTGEDNQESGGTVKADQKAEDTKAEKAADKTGEDNDEDHDPSDENYKGAFAKERHRRKEMQSQIEQIKQENQQLKETFNRILLKAKEQQEAATREQPPSFDDDPIGALKYENEQLKKQVKGVTEKIQTDTEKAEITAKQQQFLNLYSTKAQEFSRENPDFSEAYNHLLKARYDEHILAGYDDLTARQMLQEDEAALVATALNQNANPAERIYKLAQLRGYKKGDPAQDTQKKIKDNEQKIATLEKGLKASKTINNSGQSSEDRLTLESVAQMSEEDFEKVDWDKLMRLG